MFTRAWDSARNAAIWGSDLSERVDMLGVARLTTKDLNNGVSVFGDYGVAQ